jgi:F-type H+-transporting ATPase subunit b
MQIMPVIPLALALVMPFIVAFLALRSILFKPLVDYLDGRDRAVIGARDDAARLEVEAGTRLIALDKKLGAARDEVTAIRAAARARVGERQAAILHEARHRADAKVTEAVGQIDGERRKAAGSIEQMAREISADIATTVLGRQVG